MTENKLKSMWTNVFSLSFISENRALIWLDKGTGCLSGSEKSRSAIFASFNLDQALNV